MKIKLKADRCTINNLTVGQTFIYQGGLFVKIVEAAYGGNAFNAVQLSDRPGNVIYLTREEVRPVNGTFVEEE